MKMSEYILKKRINLKITQKELAILSNTTISQIKQWETGKCLPNLKNIEKLHKFFKDEEIIKIYTEERILRKKS